MMDWTPPPPRACSLTPIHAPTPLEAVRSGEVQSWTISARQKYRLLTNPDESIRADAEKLLRAAPDEREQVVERYEPAGVRGGVLQMSYFQRRR